MVKVDPRPSDISGRTNPVLRVVRWEFVQQQSQICRTCSKKRTAFGPSTFQVLVGLHLCLMTLPYSCHILRHEIPQLQFCFACHRRVQSVAIPLNTASGELDTALVGGGTFVWRSDEAHGIPRGRSGTWRKTWSETFYNRNNDGYQVYGMQITTFHGATADKVGTPGQMQSLIVDTGSGRTAFPCTTCGDGCGQPLGSRISDQLVNLMFIKSYNFFQSFPYRP